MLEICLQKYHIHVLWSAFSLNTTFKCPCVKKKYIYIYITYLYMYIYIFIQLYVCVYICIHTQTHHVNDHTEF